MIWFSLFDPDMSPNPMLPLPLRCTCRYSIPLLRPSQPPVPVMANLAPSDPRWVDLGASPASSGAQSFAPRCDDRPRHRRSFERRPRPWPSQRTGPRPASRESECRSIQQTAVDAVYRDPHKYIPTKNVWNRFPSIWGSLYLQ